MSKSNTEKHFHTGVLSNEILEALNVLPGETYLDCTFGGGTHSKRILELGGRVIALEVDLEALEEAERKFELKEKDGVWVTTDSSLTICRENFRDLDKVLLDLGIKSLSGVLFDLGVSSHQLDKPERGFSFSNDGELDMRLDQRLAVSAKELINVLNERELYELFSRLGGERRARLFARNIVRYRQKAPIQTTEDLVRIIGDKKIGIDKTHPATRVFMALRIAVNDELNSLKAALPKATQLLRPGGRLAVVSFHSLEDKIVKDYFKTESNLKILTKKPISASEDEKIDNPRSRSAKLRIAEKV
jgi:16S rRNA (cytosine1402-N4)-methyltransferase